MDRGLVARNVWMRGCGAYWTAYQQRWILHTELQEQQINIFFLGVVPGLRKSLVTITQCYVIEEWFSRFSHFYLLAGFKTAKFL